MNKEAVTVCCLNTQGRGVNPEFHPRAYWDIIVCLGTSMINWGHPENRAYTDLNQHVLTKFTGRDSQMRRWTMINLNLVIMLSGRLFSRRTAVNAFSLWSDRLLMVVTMTSTAVRQITAWALPLTHGLHGKGLPSHGVMTPANS